MINPAVNLAQYLKLSLCCASLCCIYVVAFSGVGWLWLTPGEDHNNEARTWPERNFGIERALDDKYRGRTDPGNCSGIGVYLPPCRLPASIQNDSIALARTLPNQLNVVMFVGLRPKMKTMAPMLTDVLSTEWDERFDDLNFFLSYNYDKYYKGRITDYGQAAAGGGNNRLLKTQPGLRRRLTQGPIVNMFHVVTDSDVVEKHKIRWWWIVNLTYLGYWRDDNSSVAQDIMARIHNNMTISFNGFRSSVEAVVQNMTGDALFRWRSWDDGIPTEELDDQDMGPYIQSLHDNSLDTRTWTWSQYVGLGLLVFTVTTSLLLRYLSVQRLHNSEQHQYWGNLASKDGLDDLLNTAWTLEGSKIKIYDKTKLGYNDDDSLFLGGFEQRETVVGTEITMNTPATTETPDVGTTFSHRPSDQSHSALNHE